MCECNINPKLPIMKECVGHKEYVFHVTAKLVWGKFNGE